MSWAAIAVGAATLITGVITSSSKNAQAKKLARNRKNYKTPEEIGKILQIAESMAGGDTIARDSQTNQLDRAFSQTLGLTTRLGADPNDLSSLFQKKVDGIIQIGDQFHKSNMESFSKIFDAFSAVAANKAAEQMGKDAEFKDLMAALVGGKQAGSETANNGLNTILAALAANKTSNLYGDKGGGGGGGGGGLNSDPGNPPSDIRLKENYSVVGQSPSGINIYEFSYKGNPKRYRGVMAHEVPFAAHEVNGYLHVDYSKTDVEFKEI